VRAAVFDRYGGPEVVRITEVPRPEPGRNDVLVQVRAAAVTSGDARIRGARFPRGFAAPARLAFGVRRPRRRVLGSAFSGVVAAVGPAVDALSVGDEVAGMVGMWMGAHAELLVVPAARAVRKPAAVSHEDAAGVLFGGGRRCTTCARRPRSAPARRSSSTAPRVPSAPAPCSSRSSAAPSSRR